MKTGWPDKFYVKKVNIRNDHDLDKKDEDAKKPRPGVPYEWLEGFANQELDNPKAPKGEGFVGSGGRRKARKKKGD